MHYFGHATLMWLVFKPFWCCFNGINNKDVHVLAYLSRPDIWTDQIVSLAVYPGTVGTISRPIMRTPLLSCTLVYILCLYLLRMYSLRTAVVIELSSGASVGIPWNSLQQTRSGDVSRRCVYVNNKQVHTAAKAEAPRFTLTLILTRS
jgi:hypothetical protein